MNRVVMLVLASSLAGVAHCQSDEDVAGTYRLKVTDESRQMARVMGQPAPEGALILGSDHIFELIYRTVFESSHRFGRYAVDGSTIYLRFRNRSQSLTGSIRNGMIQLGGVEYRSFRWHPDTQPPAVFYPDPNPPRLVQPAPVAPPVVIPFDAVGSWSVRNHGTEDKSSIMTFDKDGNFSFKGHGAKSRGHYKVHDGVITLVWLQIDDDLVEEGTVKKDFPIGADGASFDIDTYHYERCSG